MNIYVDRAARVSRCNDETCKIEIKNGTQRVTIGAEGPYYPIKKHYCLRCGLQLARWYRSNIVKDLDRSIREIKRGISRLKIGG